MANAKPVVRIEKITVILCEIFDDKNCDKKRVIANPTDIMKKRFPVSA